MGRRRFAPLIAVVVIGAAVLVARLFTIQVLERDVWTAQAESLLREGTLEPYTRGEIRDARGRVLARDIESYRIEVDYRDFRRGHALGVVASARSTLEMRVVSFEEARADLVAWSLALGRLSAEDLERFARGGALDCGGLSLPPTEDPSSQSRGGRALDLGFYATALLDLTGHERSRMKSREEQEHGLPFVDRVARERGTSREAIESALAARCAQDVAFLAAAAELWARDGARADDDPPASAAGDPLAFALGKLERWRADVEDGSARDLFEAAAGFAAGRIEPALLEELVDLDWIRRSLRWDEARLAAWVRDARREWLAGRDGPVLDFAVERVRRDGSAANAAQLVMRELGALYVETPRRADGVRAAESDPFGSDAIAVLASLESLFAVDPPTEEERVVALPFEDESFATRLASESADAGLLGEVECWRGDGSPPDAALLEGAAENWRARFAGRVDREGLRRGLEALCLRLEECFQERVRARLFAIRDAAREDGDLDARGRLPFAAAKLDRAEERLRYILKDRGSRHFVAVTRPSYALVNLLTRYPRHLRGFEVVRVHLRENPARDLAGRVIGRLLLGRLAPPSVSRRLSQQEIARRIALFESRGSLDEEEELELAELRASLDRPDEVVGASGLERWFEPELAGRNGFHESRGLAERDAARNAGVGVDRIDGQPITTTLDCVLQSEAEACLERPEGDPHAPDKADPAWLGAPTGAIVLVSLEGDVLVAASTPLEPRDAALAGVGRTRIADEVRERTLTKPDFQPPGSVFKPFVAAYALDRMTLDPAERRECSAAMNPGGRGPGYNGVHCHETARGHGEVDLRRALTVSCNSYFAWLGERYDAEGLQAMAHEFGFGEPTGVRAFGHAERSGIAEDWVPGLFRDRELSGRSLSEAGNGLSVVEATPMQVARATAGLATGRLPELRLVSRIGERELPGESREIALSPRALEIVRGAMFDVTGSTEGSAHRALSREALGFTMAAKTGSADVTSSTDGSNRVIKHTWVAGWFPAEDPVAVLVVFEYRTMATSSHSAVWLARQFLKRPAVEAWIREKTAERTAAGPREGTVGR